MSKFFRYSLIFILFILISISIAEFFYTHKKTKELISPVLGISKIGFADNIWSPQKSKLKPLEKNSEEKITAKAAFFIEGQTGEVLFERNIYKRYPIASLNKIMTVIITLESKQFSDTVRVSQRASEMEPDKMLLIKNETLTVEELLQGILLVSANDAAEVLAETTTSGREEFIELMNLKAKQLGMNDTKFINPTGLDEDYTKQYSSAYDVALMTRYALYKWPKLIDISKQPHIFIPKTETHQDYDLYSGINLLTTYPGVVGFKTGYTPEAGLTLVIITRREGREVIGVLLGSTNRRDDAKDLLDLSFKKLGVSN